MRLLVSVVDAGEARAAAAAGADIVDVKNPAEGSLGAPSPAVIAGIRAAVPAELPVSAAIGDMPNLPGTAALAALGAARSGRGVREGRALGRLDARPTRSRCCAPCARRRASAVVVAGAYADARRVPHAPLAPELLPRVARAAGVDVLPARHRGQGRPRAAGLALARRAHGAGGRGPRRRARDGAGRRAARGGPAGRARHRRRHRRRALGRMRATGGAPGSLDPARVRALRRCVRRLRRARLGEARRRAAGVRTCARCARGWRRGRRHPRPRRPPRRARPGHRCALGGRVSIRQRRPKPTCQRSSRSTRSTPSRTPGSAPSARSSSSASLPGVEDDSLEQHVVEADALAQPGATRRELRGHRGQPLLEELEHRRRGVRAGRGAALGRGVSRAARAPRRAMRSKSRAWRCSSRRWRKKTQAIRLSWEARSSPVRRGGERRELLGDRVLGHAEAGEQRREALAALVRELRPRAGVRG